MSDHDQSLLGPYVLGALDPADVREVEEHLPGCVQCQDELVELTTVTELLGEVPPEAFIDGPPPDGDLLLQRTVREARVVAEPEARRSSRSRWLLAAASVAVIAALGGGVLIGRQTADPVASSSQTASSGWKQASATDATTGTTMTTSVQPRDGWTWIDVRLTGVEAGAECELVVTRDNGKVYVAGSWVISQRAAREGSRFGGGVLVPVDQVASVGIRTIQGEHVVTTPL